MAVASASAVAARGPITATCSRRLALLPVCGSKMWWKCPLGSKVVPYPRDDVRLRIRMGPEMRLVQAPQRLNRNIECAAAKPAQFLARLDYAAQLGRRMGQLAGPVEAHNLAVGPVQAEYLFQAFDL